MLIFSNTSLYELSSHFFSFLILLCFYRLSTLLHQLKVCIFFFLKNELLVSMTCSLDSIEFSVQCLLFISIELYWVYFPPSSILGCVQLAIDFKSFFTVTFHCCFKLNFTGIVFQYGMSWFLSISKCFVIPTAIFWSFEYLWVLLHFIKFSLLLISNFYQLWTENICCIILVLLNLLRLL